MTRNIFKYSIAFALFTGMGLSLASAGGLSGEVARNAMCEDVYKQCMEKVRIKFPCDREDSASCIDKRYVAEKQCRFLDSHCRNDEPPVKRIKPVFPGKDKKEN